VEMFQQHPDISFILMDIKMPIMDGLEATAIIKSEKPDLPVIAITAYALTGDEQRIKQAGCDDYIAKPLTRETLIKKLQTAGIKIS
jgi:CheY-like chemotaxis protein